MLNKPINPSPNNCCVDASDNIYLKCELPNNKKIDGHYTCVYDLKTGETITEEYSSLSEPTNLIISDIDVGEIYNGNEYGWQSLYWKTPTKEPDKYWTITGKDEESGAIRVLPDGDVIASVVPTYEFASNTLFTSDIYMYSNTFVCTNQTTYSESNFSTDCGHGEGEDTSSYCSEGNLEDYIGYPCFRTNYFYTFVEDIKPGKCIINFYKDDRLVSRARCLAYDKDTDRNTKGGRYYIIIDNKNFFAEMEGCGKNDVCYSVGSTSIDPDTKCYCYTRAEIYNVDCLDKKAVIDGMVFRESTNCIIRSSKYLEKHYAYELRTSPSIVSDVSMGDTIGVWSRNNAEYNESPTYYFRTKTSPSIDFVCPKVQSEGGLNTIFDVRCDFSINYTSDYCSLDYFYLYLYVFNPKTYKWELKEKSPMLLSSDDVYEFVGFADGQKYRVVAVCTDSDGDEWNKEDMEFIVNLPFVQDGYGNLFCPAAFNKKNTTVDITFNNILSLYKTATLEFYKILKTDDGVLNLEFAGGGLAKSDDAVYFDKLYDYNIKNDSYYDYYIRVDYVGKEADDDIGIDFFLVASNIHTEFEGTSILGLEKSTNSQLNIVHSFDFLYCFDSEIGELKNEISREYLTSFNKYPKELKGNQNYISSSCSGLLGYEENGLYTEPYGVRNKWCEFINDDTTKLYRGIDGETMIISIDTSSVKPRYFPNVGIVNEVKITFKEIASTRQYAIFTTEKTGD